MGAVIIIVWTISTGNASDACTACSWDCTWILRRRVAAWHEVCVLWVASMAISVLAAYCSSASDAAAMSMVRLTETDA